MDDRPEHPSISPADPLLKGPATSYQGQDNGGHPWQTGLARRAPWTGLLSLFAALLCGIGAVVVAKAFDDEPLDYWKIRDTTVQPTVLLSIFSTLSKTFLGYAFTVGITIFWWKTALRGTTLRELQAAQLQSSSLLGLCGRRPVVNRVTFASFMMIMLLAVGPFLQRALTVVTRERRSHPELTLAISASPLMRGSTGLSWGSGYIGYYPSMYSPLFAKVLQQYNARENISLSDTGCKGTCTADVIAAGWDIQCSNHTSDYKLFSYGEWLDTNTSTSMPGQAMFVTNVTMSSRSLTPDLPVYNSQIEFSTMYKATEGSKGTLNWRSCNMSEALVRYRVEFSSVTVTLPNLPQLPSEVVQSIGREWEDQMPTLGGLWLALKSQYKASTFFKVWPSGGYTLETNDTLSGVYLRARNSSFIISANVTWADPIDDMISMLQELTFRTAVVTSSQGISSAHDGHTQQPGEYNHGVLNPNLTATNRTVQQQVKASMKFNEVVYVVRRGWLIGGFVLIVLTCFAIIPTYWGWWILGRAVSLSPLEIAKAFDAPLLQRVDANGTSDELTKAIGDLRVRYGLMSPPVNTGHGSAYEMDSIVKPKHTPLTASSASGSDESHSVNTARLASRGQDDTSTGSDGISIIDVAASSREGDESSIAAPYITGTPISTAREASHQVTTGLIASTTTAISATSPSLRPHVRPVARRPSLKFREEDSGTIA